MMNRFLSLIISSLLCLSTFAQVPDDESAKKEKGNPSTNNTEIVTHEEATRFSNDQNLLNIYNQMHTKVPKVVTPEMMYKKGKRKKVAGYVIGGTLLVAGISSIIYAASLDEYGYEHLDAYHNYISHYKNYNDDKSTFFYIGCGAIAGSAAIGLPLILKGSALQRKSQEQIHAASAISHDIDLANGASLNLGVDVLSNNITYFKTPGIGVRYNF